MQSPDSHKISLKIIEAIKQHPVLYVSDVKGGTIKLQEFRQKVWKRISDELGLDSSWVKLKWKNLRDTYSRILKYKNKSEKGVKRKKWIFEDHLSFLKLPYEENYGTQYVELTDEYIKDINTEIINPQDFLEQLDDNDDDYYSEYLEVLEEDGNFEEVPVQKISKNEDQMLQKLAIDAYAKQIQSKFRKIKPKNAKQPKLQGNINTYNAPIIINTPPVVPLQKQIVPQNDQYNKKVKKLLSLKNSFDYQTDVDNFFTSIKQIVKKLPPKVQADVKMDIHKIVSEAEMEHCKQTNASSLLKFNNSPRMIPKLVLVPCQIIDNQLTKA